MIFILIFSGNEHVSSVEFYSIRMNILLYKFIVFFFVLDLCDLEFKSGSRRFGTTRRAVLALKSDPLKPRLDQIRKQAEDHRSLALAYAHYARKLKLEHTKLVRNFTDLSRNYSDLLAKDRKSVV